MKVNIFISAVITYEDRIILVQEGKEKVYGKWNLPGGHLETDEGIVQGILREIEEETGLSVELVELLGIFTSLDEALNFVFVFRAKAKSPEFLPRVDDIMTCRWFTLAELSQLDDSKDCELINLDFSTFSNIDFQKLNQNTCSTYLIHVLKYKKISCA